ncbi:hypothetical protein Salat_0206400 [Sesamum alatum]|uniref:Uncharacterized protein n=1 Tax=Sesamum alatum TaxID=300844 RepID=A0AAE1YZP2_9LAMI|nr:hypothetical protein Salat_0206400 [Sesamum alatum]
MNTRSRIRNGTTNDFQPIEEGREEMHLLAQGETPPHAIPDEVPQRDREERHHEQGEANEQLHNTWQTKHLPNLTPLLPKKNPPSWKDVGIENKEWMKERGLKKKLTAGCQFPKKEQIFHLSLGMMD